MTVLCTFYNARDIFDISLCSYNIIIIIFKYNSNMVMIRVVEYPVKKNKIPGRRIKGIIISTVLCNATIRLRPFLPCSAPCKRTGRFFRTNRDSESR